MYQGRQPALLRHAFLLCCTVLQNPKAQFAGTLFRFLCPRVTVQPSNLSTGQPFFWLLRSHTLGPCLSLRLLRRPQPSPVGSHGGRSVMVCVQAEAHHFCAVTLQYPAQWVAYQERRSPMHGGQTGGWTSGLSWGRTRPLGPCIFP